MQRGEAGDVEFLGRFSGGGQVFVQTGSITVRLAPKGTRDVRVGEIVREGEER